MSGCIGRPKIDMKPKGRPRAFCANCGERIRKGFMYRDDGHYFCDESCMDSWTPDGCKEED